MKTLAKHRRFYQPNPEQLHLIFTAMKTREPPRMAGQKAFNMAH